MWFRFLLAGHGVFDVSLPPHADAARTAEQLGARGFYAL